MPAADHPFALRQRRLIDHRLRTPHRRYVQPKLLRVIAHWTQIPVGTSQLVMQHTPVEYARGEETTVKAPEEEPAAPEGAVVNVRALLCPGLRKDAGHVIKNIELIAVNDIGREPRRIQAYGGLVKKGTDAELIKGLCEIIEAQSGLDLSGVSTWIKFIELQYRDVNPTVFFAPALWEAAGSLKVLPQATERTVEVEEEYEEEELDEEKTAAAVEKAREAHEAKKKAQEERKAKKAEEKKEGEDEGAAEEEEDIGDFDESSVPLVMKKIKKKRTVEKVKKTLKLSPLRFNLGNLVNFAVTKQTHPDTIELCNAADALDEFIKREMATRLIAALRQRKQEAAAKAKLDEQRAELEKTRKRKRQDAEESRKRARKEKEEAMRKEWADDDEGKTDEEKRESMVERQGLLKKMREDYQKEDKDWQEQVKQEEDNDTSVPKLKVTSELDQSALDAFAYFDRSAGLTGLTGSLPRLKIENLVLCVEEDFTLEDISGLLDLPIVPKTAQVPYKRLAMATKVEEEGTPVPDAETNGTGGDATMQDEEEV
eukprot:TRINITY_DN9799_c1_g3_i1.p1 TRINITY_DN9799_c1_g3~~TRINITY_DN9799_c1_g3_i1.p1  ORF type:complete len:614 (+),score=285.85 TRINITY_DN9799_c1_g3_i1:222-1844(+)